jgi:hypothetical protein
VCVTVGTQGNGQPLSPHLAYFAHFQKRPHENSENVIDVLNITYTFGNNLITKYGGHLHTGRNVVTCVSL